MNIYQKLVEVRKSIDGFTKDASGYGYKYVSGSQVLSKIKKTMDNQGIILETHLTSPIVTPSPKGFLITSPMKMIWVNAEKPEDKIIIDWFMTGEQKDPSQGLGSGLTYSERYFLLKFFSIATDEDDPDKLKANDDTELKKQLIKKHKGDKTKAKAEYEKIKAKEKIKETVKQDDVKDEFDKDMENYIEGKFEMAGDKS